MYEHEIFFGVNNNSRLKVVQPDFATWKNEVKVSAEVANGS